MRRVKTNRKLFTGAALVAILAALGVAQGMLDKAAAQAKQVPRFEVDPFWPKPMPKNYVFGQTIGLGISSDDHVWIIHRGNDPGNLDRTEISVTKEGAPPVSECCNPAPPVMEFDAAGNNVGGWGGPARRAVSVAESTTASWSITRLVWIGGNGAPDSTSSSSRATASSWRSTASPAPARRRSPTDKPSTSRTPRLETSPRREDFHRPEGERGTSLTVPQQRVAGDRSRQRQDQGIWGAYGEPPPRQPWPVRSSGAAAAPVSHPSTARMSNDGMATPATAERPVQCSRPGQFMSSTARTADALGRLGLDIAFSKDRNSVSSHGRRRERTRPIFDARHDRALQLRVLRRHPACSSACIACRDSKVTLPTETYTASAFRSSFTGLARFRDARFRVPGSGN